MKILHIYQIAEAERALNTVPGLCPLGAEIKIEGNSTQITSPPSIMEAVNYIRNNFKFHHGNEKIPAIKWYREWATHNGLDSGLAEAKYFVESIHNP